MSRVAYKIKLNRAAFMNARKNYFLYAPAYIQCSFIGKRKLRTVKRYRTFTACVNNACFASFVEVFSRKFFLEAVR